LKRSFDDRGNITAETRTTGELTRRTAYAYDDANRITSITYPSGWTVSYTRDALGRTTSIAAQSADGN
jgi:YD repeat-containing protein